MNNRYNEFHAFLKVHSKKSILYRPIYAQITGSITAAVMLSQIMFYWGQVYRERHPELEENEFWKTDKMFMEDIHMNSEQFKYAQNILEKLNIIIMKKKGYPPRTFYKLNEKTLRGLISSSKNLAKKQKGLPKIQDMDYLVYIMRKDISIHQHVTGFLPSIGEIDRMISFLYSLKAKGQDAIDKNNLEKEVLEQRRFKDRQEIARSRQKLTKNDRSGYIYFLSSAGYVKIGKTKDLDGRMANLETCTPLEVKLLHFIKSENIDKDEMTFHRMFAIKRTKGEWFKLNENDIEKIRTIEERIP